ncbi:hypothetical protein BST61_g5941 [Cercospora zeina]
MRGSRQEGLCSPVLAQYSAHAILDIAVADLAGTGKRAEIALETLHLTLHYIHITSHTLQCPSPTTSLSQSLPWLAKWEAWRQQIDAALAHKATDIAVVATICIASHAANSATNLRSATGSRRFTCALTSRDMTLVLTSTGVTTAATATHQPQLPTDLKRERYSGLALADIRTDLFASYEVA